MYEAFFEERELIPTGRLVEISFEELERDPLAQLRIIYQRLQLPAFDAVEPAVQAYVASLAGYQKNVFPPLPDPLRKRIISSWQRCFDAWGYSADGLKQIVEPAAGA